MKKSSNQKIFPPSDSQVFFSSATAFVRNMNVNKKVIRFTSGHRGQTGRLESGYILIDQAHYAVKHGKKTK